MRRHGPVIAHCTDSEDFPNHLSTTVTTETSCNKIQYNWTEETIGEDSVIKHRNSISCSPFSATILISDTANLGYYQICSLYQYTTGPLYRATVTVNAYTRYSIRISL